VRRASARARAALERKLARAEGAAAPPLA